MAAAPKREAGGGTAQLDRRRSARWDAHVPVFIYGHTPGLNPFHERAYSTNVSALGARLIMMETVRPGQTLLLTNHVTQAEQECRVAYIAGRDAQSLEVAVEFLKPAPNFWRITAPRQAVLSFPPTDRSGSR